MATPSHVFAEIASRHGIDPNDEEAVDDFFVDGVPRLALPEQQQIIAELIERDGEVLASGEERRAADAVAAEKTLERNVAQFKSRIRIQAFPLAAGTGAALTFGELQPGRYKVAIGEDEGPNADIEIQRQKGSLRVRFLEGHPLRATRSPQDFLSRSRWLVLDASPSDLLDDLLSTELYFEGSHTDSGD